jgi:diguanylate cyclase (GGDEF)-like protein
LNETRLFVNTPENELSEARACIKRLEARIAELEEQLAAEHTVLTRPEFNREVARMLAVDQRYGGVSSVIYFDFASLSGIEKRHGLSVAAETLRIISHILNSHVRRSDIVGRLAADEFGVLLSRCDNENAWTKGRELASLLSAQLVTVDGRNLSLDISFGAYTFGKDEGVAKGIKAAAEVLTKLDAG